MATNQITTHQITVRMGPDRIEVDPDTLTMSARDAVQWAGTNATPFSIEFVGAGPFQAARLEHAAAKTPQRPKTRGRFKYSVVSGQNPKLRLDPVIIVEDPPTDPKP